MVLESMTSFLMCSVLTVIFNILSHTLNLASLLVQWWDNSGSVWWSPESSLAHEYKVSSGFWCMSDAMSAG